MKLIALFSVVSWGLLGMSVPETTSGIQYSALAILAFLVVWFCLKGFPAILKAQDKERERLIALVAKLEEEIRLLNERIRQN